MSNKDKIFVLNTKVIFLIALIVFSIHFTEFKIGVVKLSEVILLLLPPILYTKKLNKWIFYFYLLFIFWFVFSLIFNPLRDFFPLKEVSILKSPYLITIGRFLELIACLNLMALIYYSLRNKSKEYILLFVKSIVFVSFLLITYNAIVYIFVTNGVIPESNIVDNRYGTSYRLRGWFGEGGPYGLMVAFVFVLSFLYKSKYNSLIRIILFLVIVFFAKSKAGIMLVLLWGLIYYYKRIYKKIKGFSIPILIVGAILIMFSLTKLSYVYIDYYNNIEKVVANSPNDTNIVMGRIAATQIIPNMVSNNPIFGIGLGNYPIVRNNSKYRDFIPVSPPGKNDAHGFGGIVQILVDGGIVILFCFMCIIYFILKESRLYKTELNFFIFIFLGFFLTGVQIYFLYPWVLLAIIISLNKKSNG